MRNYSLDVIVHGKRVRKYRHEGLTFVEGRPGTEYSIRFTNNTWNRVLAVISVDGLSIMDGERATTDSSGYVVGPQETITVPGWRLDDEEVAKFKFGGKQKSYAKKKGMPQNIGVVGCLVFNEHFDYTDFTTVVPLIGGSDKWPGGNTPSWFTFTNESNSVQRGIVSHTAVPTGGTLSCNYVSAPVENYDVQNIGTEFGDAESHGVIEVEFERCQEPASCIEVHYDDRAGLKRRGIKFNRKVKAKVARAFEDYSKKKTIGCKPPPGWKRRK